MRHLPWIVAVLVACALIVLAYPVLKTQRQLWAVQSELSKASKQVLQAKSAGAELERIVVSLKTALNVAQTTHTELLGKLDQANSEVQQLKAGLGSAESQLVERQSRVERLTAELEATRRASDVAKAQLATRESRIGELREQIASERKTNRSRIETLNVTANECMTKLHETEQRVAALTKRIGITSAQVEQLTTERDAARSQLNEQNAQMQTIFAKAKEFTKRANARIEMFEERAKNAEAQQGKLQSSIHQANAELERLRNKLTARAAPSSTQ